MINGKAIFELMDSKGLSLETINIKLREKGMAFNVVEFVEAALASNNFTYPTIKARLLESMLPDKREEFELELDRRFLNKETLIR